MAFNITPSLGVDLANDGALSGASPSVALPYYGAVSGFISPKLGSKIIADDGHEYILAQASAAVASNAVVILTEPAMTFATGAGAWTAPTITGGVANGSYAWLMRTLLPV